MVRFGIQLDDVFKLNAFSKSTFLLVGLLLELLLGLS